MARLTNLSVTTLKRFFGVVTYKGSLSVTTLDTICQFIGAENWRAFRTTSPPKKARRKFKIGKGIYISLGFGLGLILIVLLANQYPIATTTIHPSEINFTSRVLSHTYPNSVVFDFNLTEIESEDIRIQQYWDKTKTITLHPGQSQATALYYFPGCFQAKLIVNDQVISTHALFLKSQDWLGLINYNPVPDYFQPIVEEPGQIRLPLDVAQEVESQKEPTWVEYHLIDDYGAVSGDNITLRATLQNTFNRRWAVCKQAQIFVMGTDGALVIPIAKIGCSSDMGLKLNNQYWSGKEHDLSALSADLADPTPVAIEVKDQFVRITIGGLQVFSSHYQDSIGNFVGLRFKFLGTGQVSNIQVKDSLGTIIDL